MPVILDQENGIELRIVVALVKKRVYNEQPDCLDKWHGLSGHEHTWEKETSFGIWRIGGA